MDRKIVWKEVVKNIINFDYSKKDHQIKCVYSLLNNINNRRYIGSTENLYNRIKVHKSSLLKGINNNKELQNDFDKYGLKSFVIEILMITNQPHLYEREMIKQANLCMNLYNVMCFERR